MGSDLRDDKKRLEDYLFQSTLPVWGATTGPVQVAFDKQISIHAPRVGSDQRLRTLMATRSDFNPRSPCGERLVDRNELPARISISIHAPRVGSDSFRGVL